MFEIKVIEVEMAYAVRNAVLRPNLTIEECKYEIDNLEGTFHLGAFYQDNLASIATFSLENHPDFNIERQYRLRGMATLPEYRKLGAGRLLINYAMDLIKKENINILWCQGRTSVQDYYEKLGFKMYGEVFYYEPSGAHLIMYKELDLI